MLRTLARMAPKNWTKESFTVSASAFPHISHTRACIFSRHYNHPLTMLEPMLAEQKLIGHSSTLAQRFLLLASEPGNQSLVRSAKLSRLLSRAATVTLTLRLHMATRRKSAKESRTLVFPVRRSGSPPSSTTHGTSASKKASTAR